MEADLIDKAPENLCSLFTGSVFVKSIAEPVDLLDVKLGNVRMEPHQLRSRTSQIIFQFLFFQL